ncbi:hypothetical protein ASF08_10795 [Methylobacterium sp. Leaf85]|nr:hypothetical protein ASF08_10795 [Methylobacterium sp. Leaf85]
MTPPRRSVPIVSDHALVRYMERVMGVDVEAIRAEILEEVAASLAAPRRARPDPLETHRFVIDGDALGGRVVTVLPPGRPPKGSPKLPGFHVPRLLQNKR